MADKEIKCIGCGTTFTWSEREQELFRKRKLEHEPKRCIPCRAKKREQKKLDKTLDPSGDGMIEG